MSRSLRHLQRRLREVSVVAALSIVSGCAGGYRVTTPPTPFSNPSLGVSWLTPREAADSLALSRWRAAVGQPLVRSASLRVAPAAVDGLTIVSWNIALGAGDVPLLFKRLQAAHPDRGIVLLIQEGFRGGDDVPRTAAANAGFARRIRAASDREIDDLARSLDLSLYYVPSMRNGAPAAGCGSSKSLT